MELVRGDKVKVSKEYLDFTKRCRAKGKSVKGRNVDFCVIEAGRAGIEMEVLDSITYTAYLKWVFDGREFYRWVPKSVLIEADNPLNEAEEW